MGAKTWKLAELLPAGEGELRQQGVRGLRQNPLEGGSALDAAASTGARWLHLRPLSMRKLSGRASRSSLCHSIILVSSWLGLRKPLEGARPLSGRFFFTLGAFPLGVAGPHHRKPDMRANDLGASPAASSQGCPSSSVQRNNFGGMGQNPEHRSHYPLT